MNKIFYGFTLFSFLFHSSFAQNYPSYTIQPDSSYQKAWIAQNEIEKQKNYLSELGTIEKETGLPFGIDKKIADQLYIIAIPNGYYTPTNTYIDASIMMEVPLTEEKIAFEIRNAELTPTGMIGASYRMKLASDYSIKINTQTRLDLIGSEGKTFIQWDENGFQSVNLQGSFAFCSEMIQPENPNETEVKAHFETNIQDWSNFLAKVTIDPFRIKQLPDFSFIVEDAYLDHSDLFNPAGMLFPNEYKNDIPIGSEGLWHGFYLRKVSVKLPEAFTAQATKRKEITAENLLIDSEGISGIFSAKNIIPYSEGSLNGWKYSLDQLAINIQKSKIRSAGFRGQMNLPILKEADTLRYTALISTEGNYLFSVTTPDTLEASLWKAKLSIYPTSFVEIKYENKKFIPQAVLNGMASLQPKLGSGYVGLAGIGFEQLVISTEKPYIKPGRWALSAGVKNDMLGFAVVLQDIRTLKRSDEEVGIHFNAFVSIMKTGQGEATNSFAAQADFNVIGEMKTTLKEGKEIKRWQYKDFEFNGASIKVQNEVVNLEGSLAIFKEDPIFGNGLRGSVKASFAKMKIGVISISQFGTVKGMDYWYVDGLAQIPAGIPIGPTGLSFYGFGGGAYYHMKQQKFQDINLGTTRTGGSIENIAGITYSGVSYIPDSYTGLGVKASTIIGTSGSPSVFNGNVTFEIAFNPSGGVRYMDFSGRGYFMSKVSYSSTKTSNVYASLNLGYDFENEVFHGVASAFINVVGGIIRGAGASNLAGDVVLHFEPSNWYVQMGTPSHRIGVVMGIPIRGINLGVKATSYLMAGSQLEPMPDPPQEVMQSLGNNEYTSTRNESALIAGKGLAFGSSLSLNTGQLQMLIFYAQFQAGFGFDVMLANYGETRCAQTNNPIGINGWYASGQAYAYLIGSIGIQITVFNWVDINEEILQVSAAALFRAKLPNPFWMKGNVGGSYSLLSGKIRGNCNFEVTVGEECDMIKSKEAGSLVDDMPIIADVTPKKSESNVDVFVSPQVIFNMPIGKSFTLVDETDSPTTFRIVLDEFKILDGTTEIPTQLEWNEKGDVATLNSFDILPGKKSLKLLASVHVEQYVNNQWTAVISNGKKVTENIENSFTTGEAPDYIPENNIAYSYPERKQLNFFKDEYGQGYIKLQKGMPYLFQSSSEWKQSLRVLVPSTGQSQLISYSYDVSSKQINFSIPSTLNTNQIYTFQFVNIPTENKAPIDANVKTTTKTITEENNTITVVSKQATANRTQLQEKIIYQNSFRTSEYSSFNQKIDAIFNSKEGWRWTLFPSVAQIGNNFFGEVFDSYELTGSKNSNPLIQLEAKLTNQWYTNEIHPLVYIDYPINNKASITWRSVNEVGVPPTKAVALKQNITQSLNTLTEEEINNGYANQKKSLGYIEYNLPYYMYRDFRDIQQQAAMLSIDNPRIRQLLISLFPYITEKATYDVEIKYVLPGIGKITSTKIIGIINP